MLTLVHEDCRRCLGKSPEKSGATGMNDAFQEEAGETVNRCGATLDLRSRRSSNWRSPAGIVAGGRKVPLTVVGFVGYLAVLNAL
jgi:hypothetical protein